MEQYHITGMSCAACSARVEKAVGKVPGVTACSVSLLTNSMGVEGTASPAAIIQAVEAAGYGASRKEAVGQNRAPDAGAALDALADHETPKLKRRLLASLGFLLVLMYFSMGHMMWGWPLPAFFDGNHVAVALVQMLLAAIVMVINQKFFISGFTSLAHGAPNMDTLVALGSSASFVWSTYAVFMMTDGQMRMDPNSVSTYMMELYFESAAMILTLITVGKMLEARSKGKTTDALKSLMKLAPKTATLLREGKEVDAHRPGAPGRPVCGAPGRAYPGGRRGAGGRRRRRRERPDRREHPGGHGRRGRRLGRHRQSVGLPALRGHPRRGGHHPLPDHQDGQRRSRHQGPHRQDRR